MPIEQPCVAIELVRLALRSPVSHRVMMVAPAHQQDPHCAMLWLIVAADIHHIVDGV